MQKLSRKFNSRIAALLSAVVLSLGIIFPVVPISTHAASIAPAPRVTFTFDDGFLSNYTEAAPVLAKYGFAGVSYVATGCAGMGQNSVPNTCRAEEDLPYMTQAQQTSLKNTYGWEIANHTDTHPLLASADPEVQPNILTPGQVTNELTTANSKLSAIGSNSRNFASPYGDWTPPVLANIAKSVSSHRGFADSIDQDNNGVIEHGNTYPYADYLLYDLPVQVGVSVAKVKSYIDQTIANNQWLILTFHDIAPTPSADPEDYQYSTADLDQIAAYVKSKGIQVVTIDQGLVTSNENLLTNASFDSALSPTVGDPSAWSTDAPDFIKQDTANNGNYPSPANSIHLTSTTTNTHLFSPIVAVDPTKDYVIKNYLAVHNITVAVGNEVAFFIEEFDANGNWIRTVYKRSEASIWTEYLNLTHKPTDANVAKIRLQVAVTANSGINAHLDNSQIFVQGGLTIPNLPVPTNPNPVPTGKAGDVNGDGKINAVDLSILLSNWNKTATRAQGELSGDGKVNALDLSILLSNWGK